MMKKIFLILTIPVFLLLFPLWTHSQTVVTLSTADTSKIVRTTGTTNAELILRNSTRAVTNGILYNAGNGWMKYGIVGNGLVGGATFRVDSSIFANKTWVNGRLQSYAPVSGSANYIQNQFSVKQSAKAWIDSIRLTSKLQLGPTDSINNVTYSSTTTFPIYIRNSGGANVSSWNLIAGGTNRDINLTPKGGGQVNVTNGVLGFGLSTQNGPGFGYNVAGFSYRPPLESMTRNFMLGRAGQWLFEGASTDVDTATTNWLLSMTPTGVRTGPFLGDARKPVQGYGGLEVWNRVVIGNAYTTYFKAPQNGLMVQGRANFGTSDTTLTQMVNLGVGGGILLQGSSSGSVVLKTLANAGSLTVTLPTVSGNLYGNGANSFASSDLRGSLTDESGNGAALFQNGNLGTPSAGVATNLTGTATALNIGGNAATATSTATLTNTRAIWGQNFNGSADVTGNLTGVGSVDANNQITTTGTGGFVNTSTGTAQLKLDRVSTSFPATVYLYTNGSEDWRIGTSTSLNDLDFRSATTGTNVLSLSKATGTLSSTSQVFTGSVQSNTSQSLSSPSATNQTLIANSSYGGIMAGFGTLYDAALFSRNAFALGVVANTNTVGLASLAGTGSRAVLADANGVLSAPVSSILAKEKLSTMGYGIKEIMLMKPEWGEYRAGFKNYGTGRQNFNIAEDMEKIIPEAVFTTPSTGLKGIDYNQLQAVYIKAIQDQQKIIEKQDARILVLEKIHEKK